MVLNLTRLLHLTSIQFNSGQSSIQSPSTWQTSPYLDEQKKNIGRRDKIKQIRSKTLRKFLVDSSK
jgi:hypothetical protein